MCFSHARMRGAKPRKIKAKTCGTPKGGRRRSVFPWKFGGIPANFVTIGWGQMGSNQIKKNVVDILDGQTLHRWGRGGGGSMVGGLKAATNKSSSKQKKAAAIVQTAETSTSSSKSSGSSKPQQEHKQQEKQQQAAESGAAQTAQTTTQKK